MKCANHPDKDATGLCNHCGKNLCLECQGEFKKEIYCQVCLATKNTAEKKAEHSPALAATLSLIIPGLGQFYNGQVGKGILVFLTSWLIFPWVIGIIDAYGTAKKIREGKISQEKKTGCLIAFVVMVVISWIAIIMICLLLAIAVPNIFLARISANENLAQSNLKTISAALENYRSRNNGRYPTDEYQLTSSKPLYLSQRYNGLKIHGYLFYEKLSPEGYSLIATPTSCNVTGRKLFTVTTGGIIASQDCQGQK